MRPSRARLRASTSTITGLWEARDSSGTELYDATMILSPAAARWAAAPLTQQTPLPRSPSITYVEKRLPRVTL